MKSLFRPFPVPLTARQWFYISVLQGVGAGLIDGGANFGVAYAMYHSQTSVKMWVFSENTLAGDLGVTPIIQCLASMLITSTLVHTDLHHHAIAPLPFVYPHVEHLPDPRAFLRRKADASTPASDVHPEKDVAEPETPGGLRYYYWMLIRFIFEGTEKNMMLARIPPSNWFGRLLWTAAQGAAIGIVFGFPIWCLAMVILGPIYGRGNIGNKWAPQIIKAVYGAIVGWITNPVIAILALGSQADCHLVVVEDEEQAGAADIPTIHEDEEYLATPTFRRGSTVRDTPSLSPATRLSALPVPGTPAHSARSRSGSNASRMSRPPLVTNVSRLSPLPQAQPEFGNRPRGYSLQSVVPMRPRGATVSSYNSNRSYSYALGGTGGRAQRPRASTRASATGMPVLSTPITISAIDNGDLESGNPRPAVWDVFGPNESVSEGSLPRHRTHRASSVPQLRDGSQ